MIMTADERPAVPPTRVALAGFGAWGLMHARAIAAIDGAKIVAVLARSEASRQAAAQAVPQARLVEDYAALLAADDVDVIDVVLPNNAHADAAVAALDAGKHVLLEKPLGLTLAQCDAVAAACKRSGRLVAVNHELRVSRQWGAVHEMVARGELGALRHQHLSLFRKPFRSGSGGWRYDRERVGSWVLEELVHFIDLILWYGEAGGLPIRVAAYGGEPAAGLSDHFSVVLEWDDGATAVLNQCLGGFEHHTLLEIAGSAGALRTWWSGTMDRTDTPSFELKRRRGDGEVETIGVPLSGEVFELEANLRQAFAGFAAGHSIMSPEMARLSVAVSLAAEQSWHERRPVRLNLGAG
ncbi:MAG: Gfo/Idh/MocA family oxidoreductase [Pseudomonadota bacterium]|nr:Gfo/Idh/MocA family oxidoreductase [Pseudomonadota bacterium]